MATHETGTREAWRKARMQLLEAEKDLTRRSDELARQRQALPWVRVDKAYRFDTEDGKALLPELFRGHSQLLVYHFMFGPDYKAGCPSCSMIADGFDGFAEHLANHDVMLWAISRAPLAKLQAYRERMGWTFPWASSFGSDFNADYGVGFSEQQQREGYEYNFRSNPPMSRSTPDAPNQFAASSGVDGRTYLRELPGMSACRKMARCTTPIRPTRAAWTACGAPTNGSIAHRADATKPAASGGAGATNTRRLDEHWWRSKPCT
jgi:predicted dithiol-disulfide oxidoreductase (DUF899 family)